MHTWYFESGRIPQETRPRRPVRVACDGGNGGARQIGRPDETICGARVCRKTIFAYSGWRIYAQPSRNSAMALAELLLDDSSGAPHGLPLNQLTVVQS